MKRAILIALGTGALISSAAAIGIGLSSTDAPASIDRTTYEQGLASVRAALDQRLAGCDALRSDGQRETCRVEAEAASAVHAADLGEAYHRTEASARAAQRARIDARYQTRRAQCQALGGFRRDKCLVSAHAERGRALLDASAPYAVRYTH